MAITKSKIFEVADQLNAQGVNPTLAAVRKALDGGSFTTISEAMKEWRADKSNDTKSTQEPPPDSVREKLAEIGTDIWGIALELANGRFDSEREKFEVAKSEIEESRLEAVELADQLAEELDRTRAQVANLEAVITELKSEVKQNQDALAETKVRATTAEVRSNEMELRANDLRVELNNAHAAFERFQNESAKTIQEGKSELAELRSSYKTELSELRNSHKAEIQNLQQNHDKAVKKLQESEQLAKDNSARQSSVISSLEFKQATADEKILTLEAAIVKSDSEKTAAIEEASKSKEEVMLLRGRIEGLEIALNNKKQAS